MNQQSVNVPNRVPGRVWIVGQFALPYCSAAACRVVGLARAMENGGLKASLIGNKYVHDQPSGDKYLQGLDWTAPDVHGLASSSNLVRLFWVVRETIRALKAVPAGTPRTVLIYGDHSNYVPMLLPFARRNNVRLAVDVVEWPDYRARVGGPLSPVNWSYAFSLRVLYPMVRNAVVISRYLENYYVRRSCSTVRVPPLVDCQEVEWKTTMGGGEAGMIHLVYAGSPGKKDLLGNVIRGLNLAGDAGRAIHLHVAGPSESEIRACLGSDAPLAHKFARQITRHGRLPRNKVLELVGGSDFSVLLRPDIRISNAGFPTKVAESLLMGTPVICNYTSDLADHIHDGQEGIVARDDSSEAFAAVLRRLPEFPPERLARMRLAARRRAEESFDFRCYTSALLNYFAPGGAQASEEGLPNPSAGLRSRH